MAASAPPIRRFYKQARTQESESGFGVQLDERTLRTPGNARFAAPTRALAEAIAEEWSAQGEHILPATMPLTQFAFAAIDHTPQRRSDLADYIAKFGETDLVCHRADAPAELVARQAAACDKLLGWLAAAHGVKLPVVTGVRAADVPPGEIAKLRAAAEALDNFRLTALAQATGLAGSAVIALALLQGELTPQAAFEAAALDDLWSQEKWGADAEAQARLEGQRREFASLARFVEALG